MTKIVLKQGEERKRLVTRMFNAIAARYDVLNHILSAGLDILWRKKAIKMLNIEPHQLVLDVACGTGDFSLEIFSQKKCRVIGVDIAREMLRIGRDKIITNKLTDKIHLVLADGELQPFPAEIFDAAVISFGIRNMGNIPRALAEMHRVIKKNGQVILLEFSLPSSIFFRKPYLLYFNYALPFIGRLISRDKGAYNYLPASVADFPAIQDFRSQIMKAGFSHVDHKKLLNGVAVIYSAWKK